jgi:hypothetical protein
MEPMLRIKKKYIFPKMVTNGVFCSRNCLLLQQVDLDFLVRKRPNLFGKNRRCEKAGPHFLSKAKMLNVSVLKNTGTSFLHPVLSQVG